MQGEAVRSGTHRLVFHKYFRIHHLAPALAFLLLGDADVQEKVMAVINPAIEFIDKNSK
jgi:hypothetical protein